MKVLKRSGSLEEMKYDKITRRISALCGDLNLDYIDPTLITLKVTQGIYDGISTTELDTLAAETAASMTTVHPDYARLAGRLAVTNLHKTTHKKFSQTIKELYSFVEPKTNKESSLIDDDVYKFVMENKEVLDGAIVIDRDFDFDYFGFKTLERSYLLKIGDRVAERPQYLYMRVAVGICKGDIKEALRIYDDLSQHFYTHATPTLFNAGTRRAQMSSCFLIGNKGDDIDGLFDTIKDVAKISKWAGGIGLSIHNVRARGSKIHGTNGESTGIVPMLKVYNDTAKYVNQGGKRNGSFAIYLEPWHADIEDFLRLKLNQGAEEDRARDLFYGLWIPDLFMKRVEKNENWTLMCPRECPGLDDVHSEEFDKLYTSYEAAGKGRKTMPAQKLWQMILDAQIQTGTPYLCYKDAANSKSNQKNLGTIKSSNLCTEIMEFSSPDETAVCNLGSLALPKFVQRSYAADGEYRFNFEALRSYTAILANNLDIVIDKNFYPTRKCEYSNKRHRPIGIGVQGLADVFAMLRIPWTSPEASKLNREIFENIYYAAATASMLGATRDEWRADISVVGHNSYLSFEGSPMSQGKMQFDLWNDTPTTTYLDWTTLRKMCSTGMRNSLLVAPMPTASTSQILGNNECFEPFTSNLYTRRVLSGDFMMVNKYLVEDLVNINMWTSDIRSQIMADNGSIANIKEIPADIRELYKTVWEIPQKTLIQMSRDRAPFICQSQSLNLFLAEPTYSKITSMHMFAWKQGLKTGCYYLRTKAASSAQKFTVDPTCLSCSA